LTSGQSLRLGPKHPFFASSIGSIQNFRGKKSGIKTGILGICLKNPTRKESGVLFPIFDHNFRSQGQNILKFYKNPTANIGSNCEETFDFLKFLYFLPL